MFGALLSFGETRDVKMGEERKVEKGDTEGDEQVCNREWMEVGGVCTGEGGSEVVSSMVTLANRSTRSPELSRIGLRIAAPFLLDRGITTPSNTVFLPRAGVQPCFDGDAIPLLIGVGAP